MQYIFRIFTLLFALSLVGCGASIPKFKPYKMDIQQGNVVTSEMLLKLRPGMTKSQVKFIMGTPLLVDSFHTNRWDYFYQLRKDGVIVNQRRVILEFDNDLLARVRGDVVPKGQTVDDVKQQLENEAKSKTDTEAEESPKPTEPVITPIEEPDVKPAPAASTPDEVEAAPESVAEPVAEETQTEETKSVIAVPIPVVPPVEPAQAESKVPASDASTEQETPEPTEMAAPKAEEAVVAPVKPVKPVEEPSAQVEEKQEIVLPPVDIKANKKVFRMDHQLNTDNIEPAQPEVEVSAEPVVPSETNNSTVTEVNDEPLPPEEAPGFFERMLEKIGF